ncbi:hypothetical protein C8J56DRAFT_1171260 [Mycena floridula]|nr:hypothetical protein C8J56DRAFT_1171260 [Mycena floridula]
MVVHFLSNPTDAQIEEGLSILMTAFKGDELAMAMTGGDPLLDASLFRAMIKAASLEGFVLVVTSEGSEAFESIALGFGPGVTLYGSEAQCSVGWNQFWESLAPERKTWWTRFQNQARENGEKAMGGDIYVNSWYIDILGTLPEYRSRGNASALVKAIQAKAAEGKEPVTLTTHTELNVKLYKKMGFTVSGTAQFDLDLLEAKTLPAFYMIWRTGQLD